jgi:hypothetical protein
MCICSSTGGCTCQPATDFCNPTNCMRECRASGYASGTCMGDICMCSDAADGGTVDAGRSDAGRADAIPPPGP